MRIEGSTLSPAALASAGRTGADSPGAPPPHLESVAPRSDASDAPAPSPLPRIKVLVTMVERLTGRPVRMVDASELPSLTLETPRPERPPALSSRPDWGVTLGVMDRGTIGSSAEATTVTARATVTDEGGSSTDVSASIALSSRFVADQRARVRDGVSPLTDPLLISFGSTLSAIGSGSGNFLLDLDPHSGLARLTVAADADRGDLAAATSAARGIIAGRNLDPRVNIANVMVVSSVAMNAGRQAGAVPSNALSTYQPVEPERSEAIQLDVAV